MKMQSLNFISSSLTYFEFMISVLSLFVTPNAADVK